MLLLLFVPVSVLWPGALCFWACLHQPFSIGAFWNGMNTSLFGIKRSKFKVTVVKHAENALFGLVNVIS